MRSSGRRSVELRTSPAVIFDVKTTRQPSVHVVQSPSSFSTEFGTR